MRKIFLIPLLTLMCSVMAWGKDAHVSSIADLNAKLADASIETIYLDADLTYAGEGCINILRSVVIDGQGHTLSGQGIRTGSTYSSLAINQGAPGNGNFIDSVAIKNLTIKNTRSSGQALNVRCNLSALLIDKCDIVTTNAGGNSQPITFGGNQSTPVRVYVYDSKVTANTSGYPVITFNPLHIETVNSTYTGYCGLYFKAPSSSAGSRGSIVNATNCNFECPNVHSGVSNAFSCFPLADDGITLNLHNCGINNQQIGDQNQALVTIGNDGLGSNRHAQAININISGDNSHINVGGGMNKTFQNLWGYGTNGYPSLSYNDFADINVTISGGTYSVHPQSYDMAAYGHWNEEEGQITNVNLIFPEIPEGYEVQEVNQGGVTLYRVVKKAATKTVEDPENPGSTIEVLYDLNDNVQGVDSGNNPVTSFDLCTGDTMQLNKETTTAGYVQIQNNVETDAQGDTIKNEPTTIQIGKTEVNTETQQEEKVDQTLVINNGLDVQGDSKVEVQAGSALVIGEGGINTEKPENIVIEADEEGAASLLLHPDITVNQTPELTVKMTAKQIGKVGADYFWHRFAMPVDAISSLPKDPSVTTKIFGWDYETDDWKSLSALSDLKPFYGYTLTTTADRQDVTYTFQGHLVGNLNTALNFTSEGYNFFGNSYTGYIDIVALADQLLDHADIDAAIWVWNTDQQNYHVVTLGALKETPSLFPKWKREIAPMQTFILRLATPGVSTASTVVDYNSAIWSNPRYSNDKNNAPARKNAFEGNAIRMSVAANGMNDEVLFIEKANFSDEFDKGYDGTKYMNTEAINIYSTVNNENYSAVATDQIEGKMLTIETVNDVNYTISFDVVLGETEYALRDNATNKVIAIEEGASYEFAAQPNSTVEGRFEIVDRANVVTSIDNAQDNKANVKGIYTIMGQYVGENFDVLPTGVYVVDGVKIVK